MKSHVSWNLTWREILRDIIFLRDIHSWNLNTTYVTWNLTWEEILRDVSSTHLTWHVIGLGVKSYVTCNGWLRNILRARSCCRRLRSLLHPRLDVGCRMYLHCIEDSGRASWSNIARYQIRQFTIWLPAAWSLHANVSMFHGTCNLTPHGILRDVQPYVTWNLTWPEILRDIKS